MKIGICSDHGGYALKEIIREFLVKMDFEVVDFGAYTLNDQDDYPDYVIPLAGQLQQIPFRGELLFAAVGLAHL